VNGDGTSRVAPSRYGPLIALSPVQLHDCPSAWPDSHTVGSTGRHSPVACWRDSTATLIARVERNMAATRSYPITWCGPIADPAANSIQRRGGGHAGQAPMGRPSTAQHRISLRRLDQARTLCSRAGLVMFGW
jgi:hypothetical protein